MTMNPVQAKRVDTILIVLLHRETKTRTEDFGFNQPVTRPWVLADKRLICYTSRVVVTKKHEELGTAFRIIGLCKQCY